MRDLRLRLSRPGGVRYGLTALGRSFSSGPLAQLAEWAAQHQRELAAMS